MQKSSLKKLLLLEDDLNLNETLTEFLEESGYAVTSVYSGSDAQDALYESPFDLLILDVNVPSPNGFELLQHARSEGVTTPAIYLTSRNGIEDLKEGYESGCDDYLRKPFEMQELRLRIDTLIQRNFFHNPSQKLQLCEHISYDTASDTLYHDEREIPLHAKEKRLLKLFLMHPDEQLTHEAISDHLWDYDEMPSDQSLRTYIKNLRKILGKDRIVSIKRYGYKFSTQ